MSWFSYLSDKEKNPDNKRILASKKAYYQDYVEFQATAIILRKYLQLNILFVDIGKVRITR